MAENVAIINVQDYLATRTLEYWRISSIRHGRIEDNPVLTTGDALLQAVDIIQHLGPHRHLKNRTHRLYYDIIENKRAKKPKVATPTSNLIHIHIHLKG